MEYNPNDPTSAAPPYEQVSSAPPVGGPYVGQIPPSQGVPPPVAGSGLTTNNAAALAYVTIIPAIIFLVTEPYNKNTFIRFHSVQSLGLAAVSIVLWIVGMVLMIIPILGFLLWVVIFLGLIGIWAFTVYKAYSGEWFKLPVIGDFAMSKAMTP
jgi:uncharacterized membrane protein